MPEPVFEESDFPVSALLRTRQSAIKSSIVVTSASPASRFWTLRSFRQKHHLIIRFYAHQYHNPLFQFPSLT